MMSYLSPLAPQAEVPATQQSAVQRRRRLRFPSKRSIPSIYHLSPNITQVTGMCVLVGGGGIDVLLRHVAVNHLILNGPSPPSVCGGAGGGAR